MKVSIIIPAYNCESDIEKCLNSVCQQTLKEIEVICVDDGSTDGTTDKVLEYRKRDSRVRLFKQENQGAGSARNYGLRMAKGDYVAFLDADDYYLDEDALEKMYNRCALTGVSVCGSFRKEVVGGKEQEARNNNLIKKNKIEDTIFEYMDYQMDYDYQNYIFKRKLLQDNNITFPYYRRFQDPPFFVRAMYAAKRFVFADVYLYCYRVPMMTTRYNRDKVMDLLKGLYENLKFAYEHDLDKLFSTTLMRLEYEYHSTICQVADDEMMVFLHEMNKYICRVLGDDTYVIRTLQDVMAGRHYNFEDYKEDILNLIGEEEIIYIYGAGRHCHNFLRFLKDERYYTKVNGIIVSEKMEDRTEFEGIKLYSIDDVTVDYGKIIIAVSPVFQKEIVDRLEMRGYSSHFTLDILFLDELSSKMRE